MLLDFLVLVFCVYFFLIVFIAPVINGDNIMPVATPIKSTLKVGGCDPNNVSHILSPSPLISPDVA